MTMAITYKIIETSLNLRSFYYYYYINNKCIKYYLSIHNSLYVIIKYLKTMKTMVLYDNNYYL